MLTKVNMERFHSRDQWLCKCIGINTKVVIHFTAIPCEPNPKHKVRGKPYFCNICFCANLTTLCSLSLKLLGLFCTLLRAS